MPGSFDNIKDLQFVITLSTGSFGASSKNQITLQGFRASVDIDKGGGQMFGQLRAQIWGVSASDMNSITTLMYQPRTMNPNTITITAIDGSQQTIVFQGNIITAWGVYNQPEVFLQIVAQAAYFNQLAAIAPTSFNGSVDVATLISHVVTSMNNSGVNPQLTFENNGVNKQLVNPYLPGCGMDQIYAIVQAAGIWFGIDGTTLFISPAYSPRTASKTIPQIGPTTGLMGYPVFDGAGITFQALFNPSVKFMGLVQLVTSIPRAAGQWIATGVSYKLESNKPGGAWFMTVRGNFSGIASPE